MMHIFAIKVKELDK